jgi:hypothetical protein
MDKYLKVFKFTFEVFGMAMKNTVLLRPLMINVIAGMLVSVGLAFGYSQIENATLAYVVLAAGLVLLYFIDYFNNGLTASLIYEQVTTGEAQFGTAMARTMKSLPGILTFAAISGLLDLLASYASERKDIVGKVILKVIYWLWTTAVYVVMPTMVIENTGFFGAFKKSKEYMENDPTQVGTGVIGVGIASWALGAVCVAAAYGALRALLPVNVILAAFCFFFITNIYWGVSGFIKTTYFTCFYLWAKECEQKGSAEVELAPAPLAACLVD